MRFVFLCMYLCPVLHHVQSLCVLDHAGSHPSAIPDPLSLYFMCLHLCSVYSVSVFCVVAVQFLIPLSLRMPVRHVIIVRSLCIFV